MQLRILRKIRKEFDYRSYAELYYSVKYTSNNELRICCPNCDDFKYKFYINDEKKHFYCFKCNFSSGTKDVFDLVAKTEGITRGQAMLKLAHEYAELAPDWETIVDSCKPVEVTEDEANEPKAFKYITTVPGEPLNNPDDPVQKPFWDYLLTRGLTVKEITAIGIKYVKEKKFPLRDEHGKYYGNIGRRVVIPVYGGNHKLVSWLSRAIENQEPKYLNCPNSEASRTLWPYLPPKGKSAVLAEGVLDALAIRRLGLSAYATLSKHLSPDQILLLKNWGVESVTLAWDKEAIKEIKKTVEKLKLHFTSVYVPDYTLWSDEDKDAGDTLCWEEGKETLNKILTEGLIDVGSMEYIKWQIELTS